MSLLVSLLVSMAESVLEAVDDRPEDVGCDGDGDELVQVGRGVDDALGLLAVHSGLGCQVE